MFMRLAIRTSMRRSFWSGGFAFARSIDRMLKGDLVISVMRMLVGRPLRLPRLDVKVRGIENLLNGLEKDRRAMKRAFEKETRKEAFRLRRKLQEEIRTSAPGGREMAPLSFIARRRNRTSKPLRRLASAVRVNIEAKEPYTVKLGWTGPRVSKRWKHLAKVHQEGFVEPVTEELRRRFRILGGRLGKRSKVRQYLFLKKTTTEFETPARPIMDPFWRAYELKTWENIRRNWNHKVRDI